MAKDAVNNNSALIWSVAELLRGDLKQSEYQKVVLPFTVLRRLDAVLTPKKAEFLTAIEKYEGIEVKMAIQANRWKNAVQAPEVQKVRGATSANERGMIITTSKFSAGARAEAEREGFTPVGLIDGEELIGLMVKHQLGVRRENQVVIELDEDSL